MPIVTGLLGSDSANSLAEAYVDANASTVNTFNVNPDAILTGLNGPLNIVLDDSANVYVGNWNNTAGTTVSKFAPGATTPSATLTGVVAPFGMAVDSAGNLYVGSNFGDGVDTVSKFTPGTTSPSATLTGLSAPAAIIVDGSGNLFVANRAANTVSKFAPGATTPSVTLTGLHTPEDLAFDNNGNLYVANIANGAVSVFAPGATSPTQTLTGLAEASHLAFDASGNLYVADPIQNLVARYNPGTITPSAILTGLRNADFIAIDKNGYLYVTNGGPFPGGTFEIPTLTIFAPGAITPIASFTTALEGRLAVDSFGSLYAVAFSSANTVSKFTDPGLGKKPLTVTGYTINDGNSGSNYSVTTVMDTTGVITKAPLTVTAIAPPRRMILL